MYRNCGFDPSALAELLEPPRRRVQLEVAPPEPLRLENVRELDWPRSPVWVSAGPLPAGETNVPAVRQALLLRDALGELARVFFDRPEPVPVMIRWVPGFTPGLLEGAARFGRGEEEALVSVFITPQLLDKDDVAQFADWSRGRIIEVQPNMDVRDGMSGVAYRCAIVLGGDDEVGQDADAQRKVSASKQGRKVFAVASTGGAAAERYQSSPDAFGGSERGLELEEPGSYTLLMKRILAATQPPPEGTRSSGQDGPGPSAARHRDQGSVVTIEVVTDPQKIIVRTSGQA